MIVSVMPTTLEYRKILDQSLDKVRTQLSTIQFHPNLFLGINKQNICTGRKSACVADLSQSTHSEQTLHDYFEQHRKRTLYELKAVSLPLPLPLLDLQKIKRRKISRLRRLSEFDGLITVITYAILNSL